MRKEPRGNFTGSEALEARLPFRLLSGATLSAQYARPPVLPTFAKASHSATGREIEVKTRGDRVEEGEVF